MEAVQKGVIKDSMLPTVVKEYDNLTASLKEQVEFYKHEHTALRADVAALLEENQQLSGQLKSALSSNLAHESSGENRHRAADMVANLQRQLLLTSQEKAAAMELYQTTVRELETLELELEAYRNNRQLDAASRNLDEVKQEYSTAITLLEEKVAGLQAELSRERARREAIEKELERMQAEQDRLNSTLRDRETQLENVIEGQSAVVVRLEAAGSRIKELSDESDRLRTQRDELETALTESTRKGEELVKREWAALSRVEEALTLVDAAVLEKDAALVAEAHAKEETSKLQKSVEQLLDEAGKRVAEESSRLKQQFNEQMEVVLRDMRNLQEELGRKRAQLDKVSVDLQRVEDELDRERKERLSFPDPVQMQRNVDNAYRELRRVEQEVTEVTRDRDRLLVHLQNTDESHRAEMASTLDELRKLRQELQAAHAQSQQMEAAAQARTLIMEDQVTKLEQQLATIQAAGFITIPNEQIHAQCELQFEEYRRVINQLSDMQKQGIQVTQELQAHLDAQVAAKKRWQQEVKRLNSRFEQRISTLREQLGALKKANRSLERDLAASLLDREVTGGGNASYTFAVDGPGPP
ncbi:Sodium channel and clathrin linker 1 [Gryllus bimaculatus]|nr:Sodium channel and clathrin linker 1 [Gryllus bimaculatus]